MRMHCRPSACAAVPRRQRRKRCGSCSSLGCVHCSGCILKVTVPSAPPRRTFFRATHAQLQSGLFAANPAAFPAAAFSLPNFLWGVAAVRSRSHAPLEGDKIAIAPAVDLVSGSDSWRHPITPITALTS
jgi:hypothetical protein